MALPIIGSKGGSGSASFITKPDTLRSNDSFEILLGLGSGRWKGPTNGLKSIKINGVPMENADGTSNFEQVFAVFADGNPLENQLVTFNLGGGGSTQSVGTALANANASGPGGYVVGANTTPGVNFLDLRFVVQQLFYQDTKSQRETTATIQIEMRPSGSATWINIFAAPSGSTTAYNPDGYAYSDDQTSASMKLYVGRSLFNTNGTGFLASAGGTGLAITGKTNSAFVKEMRVAVPNTGSYANKTWEVRARLVEKDTVDNDTIQERRNIVFESITAVNTAPLGDHPDWDGLVWLQLHGKASNQFNGFPEIEGVFDTKICKVPPAAIFNPDTRAYTTATWDGSYVEKFTTDPAWQIKEFIEDPVQGLAGLQPGCTLDKWDALEASKYFSELVPNGLGGTHPRFNMNLTLTEARDVEEMMGYLAGAVNSYMEDVGGGVWRLKVDKPESPKMLFTLDNIFGEFEYSHTDIDTRFNDYRGTFINEELGYETDTIRVFNQPDIDLNGTRFTEVALIGCTNKQEALRRLMFRLRVSLNEYKIVTFTTNRLARYLSPLDTILVSDGSLNADHLIKSSSRLGSFTGTTVTLRRPLRLETGVNYTIKFTTTDKTTVTRTVTNTAGQRGDVTTVYIDSALPSTVMIDSAVALQATGLPANPATFRILNIERNEQDEDQYSITASIVDAGKWNAMDNVSATDLLAQESVITIGAPTVPVGGMFNAALYTTDIETKRVLQINWDRPSGNYLDGFKLEYSLNDAAWATISENLSDSYFEMMNPEDGTYDFRITALDRRGIVSTPLVQRYVLDGSRKLTAPTQERGTLAARPTTPPYNGYRYTATNAAGVPTTYVGEGGIWKSEANLVLSGTDIGVENGATVGATAAQAYNISQLLVNVSDLQTTYGTSANAATSASNAATSASNAATSAANSASSSNAAATAKTAAETASADATTAKNAAQTASTDATAAKTAAQTAQSQAATNASNAATSATNAGNSATSASGSATNAGTSASGAATSATNAANSATGAGNSASAAAGSASSAGTSATNAGSSATSANTSATNASTSAGNALGSANNASTSATNASTSATNAAGSASNASTSANTAANSATNAGNSASAASGSASSASTSATNAGNSATSANSSAVSASSSFNAATLAANNTLPSLIDTSGTGFRTPYTGASSYTSGFDAKYTFPTVAGEGTVVEIASAGTSYLDFAQQGVLPYVAGRKYKISVRHRVKTAGASPLNQIYIIQLDASYAINGFAAASYISVVPTTAWIDTSLTWDSAANPANAGTKFIRALTQVNGNGGNSVYQIQLLKLEDVTESTNAAGSASAAATSASTATTQATNAGNSASSASTNATNASTSAGQASTSAGNASTSATSASTSASTATTQANNAATSANTAATSATNAGNSATAASGSASAASTSATNAGNSATAANSSAVNAASSYNAAIAVEAALLPSDFNQGLLFWSGGFGTYTDPTGQAFAADVQGGLNIATNSSLGVNRDISNRGTIPWVNGRTYRIKSRFRSRSGAASVQHYFIASDSTGGIVVTPAGNTIASSGTAWVDLTSTYTAVADYAGMKALHRVNAGTGQHDIQYIKIEDITSETAAAGSASAAATSASSASTSATNAGNSATAASGSATNAATSASGASTSASNASTSAGQASTSASNASGSASGAATSATNAANSATAAGNSATAASTSASNASTSATNAGTSATSATNSANTATTQAGNASSSASAAATSSSNASTSSTNAGTSATNAANSATSATNSANTASTQAGNASTSASAASTSAASASTSASSAQTSATLSANIGGGGINKNGGFDDYPSATTGALPTAWTDNGSGTAGGYRTADPQGGYAYRLPAAAGADAYVGQSWLGTGALTPLGYYVVEADVTFNSGTNFNGAGVLFRPYDAGNSPFPDQFLNFATDKDATGIVPVPITGRSFTWRKMFQVPAGTYGYYLYAMTHWTGIGSTAAALDLTWKRCVLRPATAAEIRDQTVYTPLEATVNTVAGALANDIGRSTAYWQTTVNAASGAGAFLSLVAETSTPQQATMTFQYYNAGTFSSVPVYLAAYGRDIKKTGATTRWDDTFWTSETYTGACYLEFNINANSDVSMIGLTDAANIISYTGLNYSMYFNSGTAQVENYELGAGSTPSPPIGTPRNRRFSITYDGTANGGTIIYKVDGVAFQTRTGVGAGRTFRAAGSMYTTGSMVRNLVFGSTPPVNASTVSIGATEFHVYNPNGALWKKALSIANGNVVIYGDLQVNAQITMGNGNGWPVALAAQDFNVTDGTVVTFGTTLGKLPQVDFSTIGLDPIAATETYNLYAESLTTTGFTARLKISTPGSIGINTLTTSTAPGTGPDRQIDKSTYGDAQNGGYRIACSGTIGLNFPGGGEPNAASITLSVWAKRGGVWTLSGYVTSFVNGTGLQNWFVDQSVNLGYNSASALQAVGISVDNYAADYGASSFNFSTFNILQWSVPTSSGVRTGTASSQTVKATVRP